MPSERASQEEHNDANFSFIAPSSEEYECRYLPPIHVMVVYVCVCVRGALCAESGQPKEGLQRELLATELGLPAKASQDQQL